MSCCFPGHNLHVGVTVLRTISAISFFPSDNFFYIFKKLKRITCTIILCNKKYRSPCLFKRKEAFISLSSLPWGKSLTFCTSMCSCARANDENSVRSRDAQCNTVNKTYYDNWWCFVMAVDSNSFSFTQMRVFPHCHWENVLLLLKFLFQILVTYVRLIF